jgi:nucleoside-diphosphate-sugar epimerase
MVSLIEKCRICDSTELSTVISLGSQYITSRFPIYGDFSTPKTDIDLCYCEGCGLLQLLQTTNSSELYEYEYGYRSGISNTMRQHLKDYKEQIETIVSLKKGDTIVDIGSNDSTMLQYYSNDLNKIGVDPTGIQFKEYYGNVDLLPTYFTYKNFSDKYGDLKCKLVSSISMFYDLPDPIQFAKDIHNVLEEDGIWTCEQSYLLSMLKTNSIDTICHEHLEYYALRQIKYIADQSNFKIINIFFNNCNGGSFRIYFAKKTSSLYEENIELINSILEDEKEYGIYDKNIFKTFMQNCDNEINKLKGFIKNINNDGKKVYIYGASTKGNCLLQYANLTEEDIKYAVERNPKKIGKMTCSFSEIISEEIMRDSPPEFLLVLPWHFKEEIIEREKNFLENGGQLLFPFPEFEIISNKPKVLLTGCDGFIASYIKEQFNDYTLYGLGNEVNDPTNHKIITKVNFNINDVEKLKNLIVTIRPDAIIHLAGISSSQYAFDNPIETIHTNGLVTANICDIIRRNKLTSKLLNASSSELYKGHNEYLVKENDTHKHNNHPYAIAKNLGHSMIDFYRDTYNLPFSNGIIFTTESSRKKPVFLLNKVAEHIKSYKQNKEPLVLGSLQSFRNIIHPEDVASAMKTIISQNNGDNYLICNYNSVKVHDVVLSLYEKSGIVLIEQDNMLVNKLDSSPVIIFKIIENIEQTTTNIQGYPKKLLELGWTPTHTMNDIINEIISK